MRLRSILCCAALFIGACAIGDVDAGADEPQQVSFRQHIAPILLDNCVACHGPKLSEGGYRVDSYQRAMTPGDSGNPSFAAGDPDGSEVFVRITSDDEGERMPLEGDPLSAEQIALIRRWIEQGARYDAEDPAAPLTSIVPPPVYAPPPERYPKPLPVTAVAFSADGSSVFVSGYHEITVWNASDGSLQQRWHNVGERTYALALAPDGKLLAVAGGQPGRLGEVRLVDPNDGKLLGVLCSMPDVVLDAAFDAQGKRLAVAGTDATVRIYDVAERSLQMEITSHSDWVHAVAWSHDGKLLASASRDKTAKVFDASDGKLLATFSDHGQPVYGVAFHPDGKSAYSGGTDRRIYRWNVADGKKIADVDRLGGDLYRLKTTAEHLFAVSADRIPRQYDVKTGKKIRSFSSHADEVLCLDVHPASGRLVTGSFDGQVRVWDVGNGKMLASFIAAPGYAAK